MELCATRNSCDVCGTGSNLTQRVIARSRWTWAKYREAAEFYMCAEYMSLRNQGELKTTEAVFQRARDNLMKNNEALYEAMGHLNIIIRSTEDLKGLQCALEALEPGSRLHCKVSTSSKKKDVMYRNMIEMASYIGIKLPTHRKKPTSFVAEVVRVEGIKTYRCHPVEEEAKTFPKSKRTWYICESADEENVKDDAKTFPKRKRTRYICESADEENVKDDLK